MKNKTLLLIIIVTTIIFIVAAISILSNLKPSSNQQPVNTMLPTPTPFLLPTFTPTIAQQTTIDPVLKQKLIRQMPIIADGYELEYLFTSDTFMVSVNKSPYREYKEKAQQWLKDQGVQNLNSLIIDYRKYRWVQ